MRLGWRWPRANDFTSPDTRPLRDSFTDLQKFMTWPHFEVTLTAAQAVDTTFSDKTFTAADDPYSLVGTNLVRVPSGFREYLFVGEASGIINNAGTTRYLLGWRLNGANQNYGIAETYTASGVSVRLIAPMMLRVKAGDYLSIGASNGLGATTLSNGRGLGYFLPLA